MQGRGFFQQDMLIEKGPSVKDNFPGSGYPVHQAPALTIPARRPAFGPVSGYFSWRLPGHHSENSETGCFVQPEKRFCPFGAGIVYLRGICYDSAYEGEASALGSGCPPGLLVAYEMTGGECMKGIKLFLLCALMALLLVVLSGCVPGDGKNSLVNPAGFLMGVWHGWIAPVTLVWSLFNRSINIYEIFNTGFWYNLGFYMAIISGFGGLTLSRRKSRKADKSDSNG
jgi:hypothetical protein